MVVDARGSRARPADPGEACPEPDVLRRHQVQHRPEPVREAARSVGRDDAARAGEVPAQGVRPLQPRPRRRRPAPARLLREAARQGDHGAAGLDQAAETGRWVATD